MRRPTLKKAGFLWSCSGAGMSAKGKTPASAYENWFLKIDAEMAQLLRKTHEADRRIVEAESRYTASLAAMKQQASETTPGERIPDAWIVRRICFYNQRCIDHIWQTKTLPSVDQYVEWTGRRR